MTNEIEKMHGKKPKSKIKKKKDDTCPRKVGGIWVDPSYYSFLEKKESE